MRTLNFVLSLCFVGLSVSGFSALAEESSSSGALEQLAQLRDEVERTGKMTDQAWQMVESELEVLQQRKNELTLQIQREELKSQQLDLQIQNHRSFLNRSGRNRSAEVKSLAEPLVQARRLIDGGIPIRQADRLAKIDQIEALIQRDEVDSSYVAELFWEFLAKEIRLGQTTEITNATLTLNGQEVLARVIRLGLIQVLFKTESGEYGYGGRENTRFVLLRADSKEIPLLAEAFQKFESGHNLGWFDLPQKALLLPESFQISDRTPKKSLALWLFDQMLPQASATEGELAWERAANREKSLLTDQLKALRERHKKVSSDRQRLVSEAQRDLRAQEKGLLTLQQKNEQLSETAKALATNKQRLSGREETLAKLWTRSLKTLGFAEDKYALVQRDEMLLMPTPDKLGVTHFAEVWQRALQLLGNFQRIEPLEVEVNGEAGVQRTTALRWGGLGVFSQSSGQESVVLGPGKTKELVSLGHFRQAGGGLGLFLFDGLGGSIQIKRHQTTMDWLADQIPLLILGVMLTVVLFIFTKLARV